ncbi:MAG: hypothetical protein E6H84_04365 [Chloroflexi bacterium]|nr:MAG: hypothetical protein E6H84_04365 [Chloroflexota bacterium]
MRTLTVKDRKEWAAWLRSHHRTAKEIWLVYHRKASGKPRIAYNDAVEEALRFGWIDSQQKGIDADRFAQRFSPRRPGSPWSEMNKARLRKLTAAGKMSAAGLVAAKGVRLRERFVVPRDIAAAIRADPTAARAFRALPRQYVRIRVGFIDAARNRPAEFRKRLRYFITMTARGNTFGYVKEFAGRGRSVHGAGRNDPR